MKLTSHKKLVIALSFISLVTFLLFVFLIKENFSITNTRSKEPLISSTPTEIPLTQNEYSFGNPGAPVTIVAFIDFGLSSNRELFRKIYTTVQNNASNIRLIARPTPNNSFIFSTSHTSTHLALFCASEQNKFWPYTDELTQISTLWRTKQLTDIATKTKLDLNKFLECLNSPVTKTNLESISETYRLLAPKVPTIYANNKRLNITSDIDIQELLISFTEE